MRQNESFHSMTGAMTRRWKAVLFLRIFSFFPGSFLELFPTTFLHCKVTSPHRLGATVKIRISFDLLQNLSEKRFLLPLTLYPFLLFPRSIRKNMFYFCPFESEVLPHSTFKLFISPSLSKSCHDALSSPRLLSIATLSVAAALTVRCGTADTN